MKNKILGFIIVVGIFLAIGISSSLFIIKPSIEKINEANSIIELSREEKDKLIAEVNTKYAGLYLELDNKYKTEYVNLDAAYVTKYQELDTKYALILEEHEAKYNKIEAEIKANYETQIKKVEAKYNLPMTDSRWFDYQKKASEEISVLRTKMYDEISEKTAGKSGEWFTIQKNKNNEDSLIDDSKASEKKVIDNNKYNEKDLLDKTKNNEINKINDKNINKNEIIVRNIIKIVFGCLIILFYIVLILIVFNRLTRCRNKVNESWSGINILLKRRFDLLPNFINVVKSYAKHEKSTFKDVALARNEYDKAKNKNEEIEANQKISKDISKLIMLSENYPYLKADKNFLELQDELQNTEDLIAKAREEYNKNVLKYKNVIQTFPSNLIAFIFGFNDENYFEINESEKENVKIS